MPKKCSRVQIVATIGPASGSSGVLLEMARHQMDVARLNFSHGTYDEHLKYIKNIRQAAQKLNKRIPIIQDLSGPREKTSLGHQRRKGMRKIITAKDIKDLKFGLKNKVDYVVMSYVGEAKDILELRSIMMKISGKLTPVIAKIERKKAIDNLNEIIKISDAIMIGRGDLGNEVLLEEIPFVEKMIIDKCRAAEKPVITATQMMLSMVNNPFPTRAEVTDVAYAVINGSDAVMLSEETAIGKYPVEVVKMMEKIVLASEKHLGKISVNQLI